MSISPRPLLCPWPFDLILSEWPFVVGTGQFRLYEQWLLRAIISSILIDERTSPRPSITPSTRPAVYASTESWDMSFGIEICCVKGGWFSVNMSTLSASSSFKSIGRSTGDSFRVDWKSTWWRRTHTRLHLLHSSRDRLLVYRICTCIPEYVRIGELESSGVLSLVPRYQPGTSDMWRMRW